MNCAYNYSSLNACLFYCIVYTVKRQSINQKNLYSASYKLMDVSVYDCVVCVHGLLLISSDYS